jgi:hypothetical protein
MDVAEQPGGLQTMTDEELRRWLAHTRDGLARAEASARGKKARRYWRESLELAEAEIARREQDSGAR